MKPKIATKKDIESFTQKFVGTGKVQSLSLKKIKDDLWEYKYKEGNRHHTMVHANRSYLEDMHIEFGGNNPDTCRAPDIFLRINKRWSAESLLNRGHIPIKMKVIGQRTVRSRNVPIYLPQDCGHAPISTRKKNKNESEHIKIYLKDTERAGITRIFNSSEEFDTFCQFLLTDEYLSELKWTIEILGTQSKATEKHCIWKRLKAGDGTKRMVLELVGLNGKRYTKCIRQDLFDAADDMFESPCKRVELEKAEQKTLTEEICMFAAEDGKIDMSKFK